MKEEITLRAPEPEDVDAIWLWENDGAGTAGGRLPVSRLQVWNYVQNYSGDLAADGELRLVVCAGGRPVGVVDLTEADLYNGRAAVSVYIAPAERSRGYAQAALALLARMVKGRLHQLWAVVAADNTPSLRLFAAAGYRSAGRLRSWLRRDRTRLDAILLQLMTDSLT